MKGKKDKDVYLQAITMIDPATGWIEIRSVPEWLNIVDTLRRTMKEIDCHT